MEEKENKAPKEQALVPLQIQEIKFYEDILQLALVERDGKRIVAVPVRQFCTHLGVDWSAQLQRMKRDEVLVAEMMSVVITTTLIAPVRGQRPSQPAICLPFDIFPGWLFTITASRVDGKYREKIQRYRRNCYRVLAEAFWRGELFAEEELLPPPATTIVVEAANDPLALMVVEQHTETMASQARIEAQLDQAVTLLIEFMSNQQARIDKIDERTQRLTPAHAQQISEAVERLCHLWRKKSPHLTDDKAHSWAYHRIHQRFGASSYKEIADERFAEVLAYVRKAIQRASDGTEPEQGALFDS